MFMFMFIRHEGREIRKQQDRERDRISYCLKKHKSAILLAYRIAYRMWPTQEGLDRPLELIRQTLTKCRLILVSHFL